MKEIRKELEDRELETVTGGTDSGSGYNYVNMYFEGSNLILYSGYNISNVNVFQDGLLIRYTYKMTSGQREPIIYSATAPLLFKVTGRSASTPDEFEYDFNLT